MTKAGQLDIRTKFMKHFGCNRQRFYRSMNAKRIDVKYLEFFAKSFGVTTGELLMDLLCINNLSDASYNEYFENQVADELGLSK